MPIVKKKIVLKISFMKLLVLKILSKNGLFSLIDSKIDMVKKYQKMMQSFLKLVLKKGKKLKK